MITKTRIEHWSNNENFSLSPPCLAFLAWGDFNARSRFARSTIPEEKWELLVVYETTDAISK